MKLSSTPVARPNQQMRLRLTLVLPAVALLLALAAAPLHAKGDDDGLLRRDDLRPQPPQSALPSTPPTSQSTPAPATAAASQTPTVVNAPATHRARVIFVNGLLEVRADNSSLLQILHDISRTTRMTITGGVGEQRIFGDYGPAAPATVLATLLDGTGANMLLRQNPVTGAPVELILTQRANGATPSSPNGPGFDDSPFPPENAPPAQPAPVNASPQPATTAPQNPVNSGPTNPVSTLSPPPPGLVGQPKPPPGTTRNADGTTSAATPESVYQQLIEMQKARAAATATAPASTPATKIAPASTTPH